MAKAAGEENFFLFGLTAEEVLASRGWYNPFWHYEHEPECRHALDMIRDNAFHQSEPEVGHSGTFSSDRTMAEYADEIWRVKPCPVA